MVHDDLQLVPAKLIKQRSSTLGVKTKKINRKFSN
jgi:hypothetical protein